MPSLDSKAAGAAACAGVRTAVAMSAMDENVMLRLGIMETAFWSRLIAAVAAIAALE
jgi:hypothetical protein